MSKRLLPYLLMCLLFFVIVGCSVSITKYGKKYDKKYQMKSDAVYFQNPNNHKREKYLLDCKDIVSIVVFDVPELSMKVKVSDEGLLSYPLVGDIIVKGLTTGEVEKVLEERLKDGYVKKPEVTVMLDFALMEGSKEKEVFVIGEVNNTGAIPMIGRHLSLLGAVAKAGGFTKTAAPQRTRIVRVIGGEEKTIMVDLNNVRKGDQSSNIILQPGDIIIVPESYF
jgi:polysaccharide export outer membrane protein